MKQETEDRIKEAADIVDVLTDQGVTLRKSGANMIGYCPFHKDKTVGSFIVSPSKNVCSCFSCGKIGVDPIEALIELKYKGDRKQYPQALRYLAAMYHIYVDDEPEPKVDRKAPRLPAPPLKPIMWTTDIAKPYRQFNDRNPLLQYLESLPFNDEDRTRLRNAMQNYCVGTYPSGDMAGWTIWWIIDQLGYVRSGKLMAYKPDGHRDHSRNATWVHTLMAKAGKYNPEDYEPNLQCLFGQHLMDQCPQATVRIVESEKTAVICSAFTSTRDVIWMATGGLSRLNGRMLEPLIKRKRRIELWPDKDGLEKWKAQVEKDPLLRDYKLLKIEPSIFRYWKEEDGEKADAADIMIRIVKEAKRPDTIEEAVHQMTEANPQIQTLINNLGLEPEKIEHTI